jgi:BRCT domain type II-containing protein
VAVPPSPVQIVATPPKIVPPAIVPPPVVNTPKIADFQVKTVTPPPKPTPPKPDPPKIVTKAPEAAVIATKPTITKAVLEKFIQPPLPTSSSPPSVESPVTTKTSSYFSTTATKPSLLTKTPEKPSTSPKKTSSPEKISGYSVLMNRPEHPPNKGQKPLPVGPPGCLEGLSFIITGILDSLEREEASKLIESYGGYYIQFMSLVTLF